MTTSYGGSTCASGQCAAQRQVGEEQVVVHHHHLRVQRPLPHAGDEAALVVRAALAQPQLGRGGHLPPHRRVLGQRRHLRPVAAGRLLDERRQPGQLLGAGVQAQVLLARVLGEAAQADVVAQALHHRVAERPVQHRAQPGQVQPGDLVLQGLGAGGHHHLAPRQDGRHQIGQRLARPGARLHQQPLVRVDRLGHPPAHRQLSGPALVADQLALQRAARPQHRRHLVHQRGVPSSSCRETFRTHGRRQDTAPAARGHEGPVTAPERSWTPGKSAAAAASGRCFRTASSSPAARR